jgi:ABC-type antimicrobial peptide transport system permease subunit
VYATTAYSIFQRRRELNIRAALGARVPQVVSLVLRQSLAPVVAGLAGGVAGALAAGGLVGTLLYEVRPRDPAVLTIVVAVVASVGIVSAGLATLGGLRINPAAALRED